MGDPRPVDGLRAGACGVFQPQFERSMPILLASISDTFSTPKANIGGLLSLQKQRTERQFAALFHFQNMVQHDLHGIFPAIKKGKGGLE
jgi:hypothetical protein